MELFLNVEPQTGNRKPRLEVRGKLGSKTLYLSNYLQVRLLSSLLAVRDGVPL